MAVGDFNADSETDLAVANQASVSVLLGNGDGTLQSGVDYGAGASPYSVAVGDFNADSKPDLAVANYYSGNVSVLLNSCAANHAPTASAGFDARLECATFRGSAVILDGSGSSDPDSAGGTNENFGAVSAMLLGAGETLQVTLPLGVHDITLRVTDRAGATSTDATMVSVVDTTPPTLGVSLSPTTLWPPNHRMVAVTVAVTAADACGVSSVQLASATSSEPEDASGSGDGNTTEDLQGASIGTPDTMVLLRAERTGDGPGRIYTLTYAATDASGNTSSALGLVTVPHDLGTGPEPVMMSLEGNGTPGMAHLYWNAVSGAEMYDVIQGGVSQVTQSNGKIWPGLVHVLATGQSGTSYSEGSNGALPPPGSAFFYLVQYRNTQGASGWGTESSSWPAEPVSCDVGCPGKVTTTSVASSRPLPR